MFSQTELMLHMFVGYYNTLTIQGALFLLYATDISIASTERRQIKIIEVRQIQFDFILTG